MCNTWHWWHRIQCQRSRRRRGHRYKWWQWACWWMCSRHQARFMRLRDVRTEPMRRTSDVTPGRNNNLTSHIWHKLVRNFIKYFSRQMFWDCIGNCERAQIKLYREHKESHQDRKDALSPRQVFRDLQNQNSLPQESQSKKVYKYPHKLTSQRHQNRRNLSPWQAKIRIHKNFSSFVGAASRSSGMFS